MQYIGMIGRAADGAPVLVGCDGGAMPAPYGGRFGLFAQSFGAPAESDVGRLLFDVGGIVQMESSGQAESRRAAALGHDPDAGADWRPLVAYRRYACRGCGHVVTIQTNHAGVVPATRCGGKCRQIIAPHTAREQVLPFHGPHIFIGMKGE